LKQRLLSLVFVLVSFSAWSANRYWVGGSGAWNEQSHWSETSGGKGGATLPTNSDQVFFDGASLQQQAEIFIPAAVKAFAASIHFQHSYEQQLIFTGAGQIFVSNNIQIETEFEDRFTGTWTFLIPDFGGDSPSLIVSKKNHLFQGKLAFKTSERHVLSEPVFIEGNLFVNNVIEVNGFNLYVSGTCVATDFLFVDGTLHAKENYKLNTTASQRNTNPNESPLNHIVTVVVIPNLCNGQCTATATATVTGGSGNFSYTWSNSQSTPTATGLCAGTYLVVVTDLVGGDQVPAFAIVTDPPPLVIFFSNTPPLCNGQCTGSSSSTVAGGTPGYTYLWSPGAQTTPAIANQCAGTYTLAVTDLNGCTVSQISIITQPTPLLPNGVRTNITCNSTCNGTATVAPSGGTGPYSVNWMPGNFNTNAINNLCPGSYTCTVTDANNCTATFIANISQPTPIVLNITPTHVSCFGQCNGVATSTVSGGVGPYTYLWQPGGQTTSSISGQCAGTYTLTVTDAQACTAQQQVTITQPPQLNVNPTGVNITCFNACNGTALANASGGTPVYTYAWAPSGGNGPSASGLCPNTYTVTVTDALGCTAVGQVQITQPQLLLANASQTNVTCNNVCNGTATANPIGGTGPYSYIWTPGNFSTQSISGLCPGTYTVVVTDANNCTSQQTVQITQPNPLQTTATVTNVTCNGNCNGGASIAVTGGTSPYAYLWLPGNQTTSSISGQCAGTYTVVVTDAAGCTTNRVVTITQPNPLTVSINATQLLCNSSCNATAAAAVSGGTAPYSYIWMPGNQISASITGLCAGNYTVNITDAAGCIANNSIIITQPTPFTVNASTNNVECFGQCNGDVSLTVSGATGPYSYSWAPGGQTTPFVNGLCASIYTVTITDVNGCDTIIPITITEPLPISLGINSSNVSCNGGCNGMASSNPSGGTGPYTFLWLPGGQTTSAVNGLCAGSYTLTVSDALGCSLTQTVTITQPAPLSAQIASTTSSCGICNGTATVAVSGGTAPYAYFWLPSGSTNPTATGLCVGQQTCTVTDAAGCATTAIVTINQVVNISITSAASTPSCFGSCDGVASANASGGTAPYTYVWQPGNIVNQNLSGLCAGTYTVTATDANGCFNTTQITFVDPPLLVASTSAATNVSCFGACDGTASVSGVGGTGTYTYLWMPGGQTTAAVTNLCAGTYTATISDANNCTAQQIITISEPSQITISSTITPANCTLCDGAITITPSGGSGPYSFLWLPGNQTTATITNLCPGIYSVTITDATGCTQTQAFAVGNLTGPTLISSSINTTCNGACNGTANVTVTGGAAPFTYDWSPGNPTGDGTDNVSGLCAGTWFVQVTDAIGCISFQTIIITEPQPLVSSATITNASCNGVCDGTIATTTSGGTGPYSFLWAPGGQTTSGISGQCAGTYTLTTTDANGCNVVQPFTITEPLPLNVVLNPTNVLCNGACNGAITSLVAGGTAPFSYVWSSGPITPSISNLCIGTYSLTVTDASGCTTQHSVSLTEPTPLISSITHTDALCSGSCDGTATVLASGGVSGYTYTWSPGGGTTPTATGLCAGAYSVITLDANGCASVSSVTIQDPPPLVLSATASSATCFGDCDAVSTATVSGGTPGYTFNWMPSAQTTPTATALCAGIYTLTITDLNGCTSSTTTSITQPALLQANTSFTAPSCNGTCDGTATASPIGGTGVYTYLWAPGGQTTANINNLCPGSYTVTVRDANGCTAIQVVNVLPTSPIALAVASAPANCGFCNGTINITPSGGNGPYSYAWSGGLPAQPNQSGLCAGIYSVVVTDAFGCSNTFTLTMNNSGGPTGENVTTSDVTCPGSCDGSATVLPIGGTSPYTYLWNPGNQTTNALTNMCAGNYLLQVTDSNGCIRFSPVAINEPLPIVGNPFVTNATCTGICDGAIALNTAGGTGPYTYSWAPTGQTTSAISGLCVGTYTVTITDANGCIDLDTATINPYNILSVNITSANVTCSNSCDASASVSILTGTAPFIYQWNDPLSQSTSSATALCVGTYTVTINDANGCNTTQPVTINGPAPIIANPIVVNASCGQCNGNITLNASGGTGALSYLWSSGATTASVSGLCAGIYFVVVTDAAGCQNTFTINMSNSNGPTASNAVVANVSCANVCDGAVALAPTGGAAPYTYLWLPGNQTTASLNGLCAGTYTVQVTDANGCILVDSVSINAPALLAPNPTIINTDCGLCNGSISLAPTGGVGPYSYNWLPGNFTTSSITNLCAGLYTVTITDATGCTATQVIPVINPNTGMVAVTTNTSISCNGSCNGLATVGLSAGNGPFTFLWSNGSTNDTISSLCAGFYLVLITDANGCVTSAGVTISEPSVLVAAGPFAIDELCSNACNGTITSLPAGGTLPYTYVWSNAQTGQSAVGLCAGTYTVVVTDANGCTIQQIDSIQSPAVLLAAAPLLSDASCNTVADGSIDIGISGGTAPYTYSWNGPNGFFAATEDLTNVFSGTYTVTATDANGCTIQDTIILNALLNVVAIAGNDTSFCASSSFTLDGSASTGATGYQWFELPSMNPVGSGAIVVINNLPLGVTSYVLLASDGACVDTDTITISSFPPPIADAGPTVEIITGGATVIGGNPTGPNGTTFTWTPNLDLTNPNASNPTASPDATTTYTVLVTDSLGCSATDTVTVIVVPEIAFPNGFTPNGDGINDVWVIDNIQLFPNSVVEVYNRWGELLFRSVGYTQPWDGRFDGQDLPVGTYYYIIDLNDPLFTQDYTGPITILR
jgi:gliding motility-associated-like protein